jgi:hypothetical protein
MTATEVDGKKVIAVEPVLTPLSTPDNSIFYKQTVLLLLEDDTEVYGCNHAGCSYASTRIGSVRSHLVVHNGSRKKRESGSIKDDSSHLAGLEELTLAEIMELASEQLRADTTVLDKVREDRDSWKARAKEAESKLVKVKKAWQSLTGDDPTS